MPHAGGIGRVGGNVVVTIFLNSKQAPKNAIKVLYCGRWNIAHKRGPTGPIPPDSAVPGSIAVVIAGRREAERTLFSAVVTNHWSQAAAHTKTTVQDTHSKSVPLARTSGLNSSGLFMSMDDGVFSPDDKSKYTLYLCRRDTHY
jgi:hypothetical protein